MGGPISPETERELEELAQRFGEPRRVQAEIFDGFHDPIRKPDRFGEVCMVIRRPSGKLLVSIKTIYPRAAFRLPTGGIRVGESVLDALRREAHEETGLDVVVERFLARISYRPRAASRPVFHTFAFLLREEGGTLGTLDRDELIEEYAEIDVDELPAVGARLAGLTDDAREGRAVGSWRDWGRFRAIVHDVVHEVLVGGDRDRKR